MATKGSNKQGQGTSSVGWSDRVRDSIRGGSDVANNKKRDDESVPWTLIVTVLAVILMFFIVMPIIGFMLWDAHIVTQAAIHEVRKMRELRRDILIERMYRD